MPAILAKTDKSRVYQKGSRYLVSQVRDGHLCRVVVDEGHAMSLIQAPDYYWDTLIDDLLTEARSDSSADYLEVKL